MEEEKFKIESKDNNRRLDQYLVEMLDKKYSRSSIQKLIAKGAALIDKKQVKSHHKLKEGEEITISLPEIKDATLEPQNIDLDVLYEDDFLLVINKASGMIVHPTSSSAKGTLVNALIYHEKNLSILAGELKPGIVHRLDKDTSGLIVVAKNDKVHEELARQFKERAVRRNYIILVHGVMHLDAGVIDAPIGRSSKSREKMAVDYLSEKDAITFYKVLKRFKNETLLDLEIKTGRTHQIRVHFKHIGYPIIGDVKYGVKKDAPRQMLHAKILGFIHPDSREYMEFISQIPEDMQNYIKELRF